MGKPYRKNLQALYKADLSRVQRKINTNLSALRSTSLKESFRYVFERDGKLLRPLLVLVINKAFNSHSGKVHNLAVAIEILHNCSIIHDDIMDNGVIRRGKPTLYKKFGIANAVLTGDVLFSLAYRNLLTNCDNGNAKKVLSIFTDLCISLCEGQSLDIEFESRKNISIVEYKKMIYKKTASLTEASCELSAFLSGAQDSQIEKVKEYGKYFGIAFQIRDDLLDIYPFDKGSAKTTGGDLLAGKKTFLLLRALEKAQGDDAKDLANVINKKIPSKNLNMYKEIYTKLGIIDCAEREIKKYVNLALKSLSSLENNEGKEELVLLAQSLLIVP